jgi:hypothetical protein
MQRPILAALAWSICMLGGSAFAQDVAGIAYVTPHMDSRPSNLSGHTAPETQLSPRFPVDEGALWTPDDVGPVYDLSGPEEDDPLSAPFRNQ